MTKVLLTAHILEQLLQQGHQVVTTVRSEGKAQKIRDAYKDLRKHDLEVVIVPDIAREDAFDEVVKTPGLEVVLHTASPFHTNWSDPQKELVDPAVIGTTAILRALHRSAPSMKRVVITSSFAAIVDEAHLADPSTVYTEKHWNPVTLEEIHRSKTTAYRASKKLAEKAAWDFIAAHNPSFDLVAICPALVLGPIVHHLSGLDVINTSNERVLQLLRGEWKEKYGDTGTAYLWVDVRDLATAHIRAFGRSEAGGQRLLATTGWFSNAEIASIIRNNFPEYTDRLPQPNLQGGDLPPDDKRYGFDNSVTNAVLGIEWTPLEKSITDLVKDLKSFGL